MQVTTCHTWETLCPVSICWVTLLCESAVRNHCRGLGPPDLLKLVLFIISVHEGLKYSSCFAGNRGIFLKWHPAKWHSTHVTGKYCSLTHILSCYSHNPFRLIFKQQNIKEPLILQAIILSVTEARVTNRMKPLHRKPDDGDIRQQRYNQCHSYSPRELGESQN